MDVFNFHLVAFSFCIFTIPFDIIFVLFWVHWCVPIKVCVILYFTWCCKGFPRLIFVATFIFLVPPCIWFAYRLCLRPTHFWSTCSLLALTHPCCCCYYYYCCSCCCNLVWCSFHCWYRVTAPSAPHHLLLYLVVLLLLYYSLHHHHHHLHLLPRTSATALSLTTITCYCLLLLLCLWSTYLQAVSGNADTLSLHSTAAPRHTTYIDGHLSANIETIKGLSSPYFPLDVAREFVMTALTEAVKTNQVHNRDPIGGSNENLFVWVPYHFFPFCVFAIREKIDLNENVDCYMHSLVLDYVLTGTHLLVLVRPLLKLVDKLLLVGILHDDDITQLLIMIDPQTWDPDFEAGEGAFLHHSIEKTGMRLGCVWIYVLCASQVMGLEMPVRGVMALCSA